MSKLGEVPMRHIYVSLLGMLFTVGALGSVIPPNIEKTVVFIYTDEAATPGHAYGTGFLMGIPVPMHPEQSWVYLVTAQHVLHTDGNDLSSPLLPALFVRINRKSGDSSVSGVPLRTSGPFKTVFLSPDPDVDIAVLPLSVADPDQFDVQILPEVLLANEEDIKTLHIGIGTDMFFAGMFTPFQGQKRNQPIVRFGRLAMIPEEKINFNGHSIDAYLVETFSFGGNSGSPVFFYPSVDNMHGELMFGPTTVKIAGVMKGFFGDIEPILAAQVTGQNDQAVRTIPVSKSNTGVAVVVPAAHIKEILHSVELEKLRQTALSASHQSQ